MDRHRQSPLTPELKEFIDSVIVPILVKDYLAATGLENQLAAKPLPAAHFLDHTSALKLRNVKP